MPEVKLVVPYKSQLHPVDADFSHNDCGPTCIAMIARAAGHAVSPDQVYMDSNFWSKGLIAVVDIQRMGNRYGLDLRRHADGAKNSGIAALRSWIDDGRPSLLLVDYRFVNDNRLNHPSQRFRGGHFVVAVGYGDDVIYIHDPLWPGEQGAYRPWPTAIFDQSWAGVSGDQYDRTALVPRLSIADPESPRFQVPADIARRLRAKAVLDGRKMQRITSEAEYQEALAQLGTWGSSSASYTTKEGDTVGSIALATLGSSAHYGVIAAFNNLSVANPPIIGKPLQIPEIGPAPTQRPATFTNQDVINAFHETFRERGAVGDVYWKAVEAAGIASIAFNRQATYTGPRIEDLPALDPAIKAAVLAKLGMARTGVSEDLRHLKAAYPFTNQVVINAFFEVYRERNAPPNAFWEVMVKAGLADVAKARSAYYSGPPLATLPNLDPETLAAVLARLGTPVPEASERPPAPVQPAASPVASVTPSAAATKPHTFTNQDVINAFYHAYQALGAGPNEYWVAMTNAGLQDAGRDRRAVYTGPAIESLSGVPDAIKQAVLARLHRPAVASEGQVTSMAGESYTNQEVIRAFHEVYQAKSSHPEAYWRAIVGAGLAYLAEARQKPYTGPAIRDLPNLPEDIKSAVERKLAE